MSHLALTVPPYEMSIGSDKRVGQVQPKFFDGMMQILSVDRWVVLPTMLMGIFLKSPKASAVFLCIEIEIGCKFVIFTPRPKVDRKENSESEENVRAGRRTG
jgi:hypothetical protein